MLHKKPRRVIYTSLDRKDIWKEYYDALSIKHELDLVDRYLKVKKDTYETYLPKEGRILDAGCGMGKFVIYLKETGYNIFGVDTAFDALYLTRLWDPSLRLIHGDVENLPFLEDSFDAYISNGVIEHFEEGPEKVLCEARRVLKNRGLLFLSIPMFTMIMLPFYIRFYLRELVRPLRSLVLRSPKGVKRGFYQYDYTRKEVIAFLNNCGFEILALQPEDLYTTPSHRIGIHRSLPITRNEGGEKTWELNTFGRILAFFLESISPWLCCSHINCVAINRKG